MKFLKKYKSLVLICLLSIISVVFFQNTIFPSPQFDEACYLERYPDIALNWVKNGGKAIDHWTRYGKNEGRIAGCDIDLDLEKSHCKIIVDACKNSGFDQTTRGAKLITNCVYPILGRSAPSSQPLKAGMVIPTIGQSDIQACFSENLVSVSNPVEDTFLTTFNESCYLKRYSDVRDDWVIKKGKKAIDHWTIHGQKEKRIPGCGNGVFPTVTSIQGSGSLPIKIAINPTRFASAISSFMWNGKEFINNRDHGRQLQTALSYDGFGECNNPTEAGSEDDWTKTTTTSKLILSEGLAPNILKTSSQMAYWVYNHQTGACTKGADPRVTKPLSNQVLNKNITIGVDGDERVVKYIIDFIDPAPSFTEGVNYEYLTGYLNSEFKRFWYVRLSDKTLHEYGSSDLEDLVGQGFPTGSKKGSAKDKGKYDPVIVSTLDGRFAMGVYTPTSELVRCGSEFHGYNLYTFNLGGSGTYGLGTNKWSLAVHEDPNAKCLINGKRSFTTYTAVGTVEEVSEKLLTIAKNYP